MTVFNKGRALHLANFAKYLNFTRANDREFRRILRFLESIGFVEVQQGGFLGHSMFHEKIVAVKKPFELDKFRRVILRTNYVIGDFTVHVTGSKRKCNGCHQSILPGMHYGGKGFPTRKKSHGKRFVYTKVLCLPCLLEQTEIEELL